jgi:site-specific DNA-methyltransferase (adenine-specific)
MTPYYQDDAVTIYHGDCREILPTLGPVDTVVTDPPYASGSRTEAGKNSSGSMVRGQRWAAKPIENDQMTTIGFVWLLGFVSSEWRRMLPLGGSALVFIDWRQWFNLVGVLESSNLRLNQMVVWDKKTMGLGNGFRAQHELIAHVSNGTPSVNNKGTGNVLRFARDGNADHPSPKPVPLIERLIDTVAAPGAVVLDSFAGAGSTLVAAKNLGRKAIGIEIEERYCEIAAKRMAQEVLPLAGSL